MTLSGSAGLQLKKQRTAYCILRTLHPYAVRNTQYAVIRLQRYLENTI